jgi:hypothetical protein
MFTAAAAVEADGFPGRRHGSGTDAIQPRPGTGLAQVITSALAERHQERLRDQVVGRIPAPPPRSITMDHRRVPVKHRAEPLRKTVRLRDQGTGTVVFVMGSRTRETRRSSAGT